MSRRIFASLVVMCTFAAQPLFADFHQVASGLRTLGFERTWVPFLGLARSFVRIIHPKGVHDFQIAIYDKTPRVTGAEIEKMIAARVGRGFRPLVRTYSSRNGEAVFIYARPSADARMLELIVLAHERNETVLMRVAADATVVGRELEVSRRVRHSMAAR